MGDNFRWVATRRSRQPPHARTTTVQRRVTYTTVLLLWTLLVLPRPGTAFVSLPGTDGTTNSRRTTQTNHLPCRGTTCMFPLWLAKKTIKGKKKTRRNERQSTGSSKSRHANTKEKLVREVQPKFQQHSFSFSRSDPNHQRPLAPLRIQALQIEDPVWWQQANDAVDANGGDDRSNPFGARLWPSALGLAEFLVSNEYHRGNTGNATTTTTTTTTSPTGRPASRWKDRQVLELGCGGGLCSIVAASLGAQVVASDISPLALEMTNLGWTATQHPLRKAGTVDEENAVGTMTTLVVDLASRQPLPIVVGSEEQPIVLGAAMLYSRKLALLLARRAYEATRSPYNAWVILGDDDSGEREGGRSTFFAELDRLEQEDQRSVSRTVVTSTIQCPTLKWSQKPIQLIHLNRPIDSGLPFIQATSHPSSKF